MSPTQNEKQQEIDRLREQVKRAEEKGLHDTAHHEMLKRLLNEPKQKKEAKES